MGAAGSGTSTLGCAVAEALGCPCHDTDEYLWLPTDPPYQELRPVPERLGQIERALDGSEHWVLAGAVAGWGERLVPRFELVVFLSVETETRLARLKRREAARHGPRIEPGGDLAPVHAAFLAWAAGYETGGASQRSRAIHESWLADLPCPVLRLNGHEPVEALRDAVLQEAARHARWPERATRAAPRA